MANLTFSSSNINKPAPKGWRKFENAYFMALAPALLGAIQSWGLSDDKANKGMIILTLFGAAIKFTGFIIANGEEYAPANDKG